jgi:hypothetical protein
VGWDAGRRAADGGTGGGGNLTEEVKAPLTNATGGTSAGNFGAGMPKGIPGHHRRV